MEFEMKLNLDNDAFCDGCGGLELARILRKAANQVESYPELGKGIGRNLQDGNGNSIGHYCVDE